MDRTVRAVDDFGKGMAGDGSAWILGSLPTGVKVTAVVEFRQPIKEQKLGSLDFADGVMPVFLSRARLSGPPIFWSGDEGCPEGTAHAGCREYSSVQQFKAWAAKLIPNDDTTLRGFGLSLADIRKAASEGLIYGTLIDTASPAFLRDLMRHPNIGGVWITDMQPCPRKQPCP
jgi:hypothetical protein